MFSDSSWTVVRLHSVIRNRHIRINRGNSLSKILEANGENPISASVLPRGFACTPYKNQQESFWGSLWDRYGYNFCLQIVSVVLLVSLIRQIRFPQVFLLKVNETLKGWYGKVLMRIDWIGIRDKTNPTIAERINLFKLNIFAELSLLHITQFHLSGLEPLDRCTWNSWSGTVL